LALSLVPSTAGAIAIVRPETIIRWHRVGFGLLALAIAQPRWQTEVPAELRALIGE